MEQNGCFTSGSFVTGRYGFKPVESIKPDDRVKNGPLSYGRVIETSKASNTPVINISVSGSEDLVIVPDKKLFVRECAKDSSGHISLSLPEWVEAGNLSNQHMVGYCLDQPMTTENRLFRRDAKKIAEFADQYGYFPKGVFDITVFDQKQILTQLIWLSSRVESRGRGTYVAIGVKSKFMAYSVARMARNCYQAAVDIERNDGEGVTEYPYFVKVMINTEAAESCYEDGIVWQPVRGITDTGQTANVYEFRTDSEGVCLINGLICEAR